MKRSILAAALAAMLVASGAQAGAVAPAPGHRVEPPPPPAVTLKVLAQQIELLKAGLAAAEAQRDAANHQVMILQAQLQVAEADEPDPPAKPQAK